MLYLLFLQVARCTVLRAISPCILFFSATCTFASTDPTTGLGGSWRDCGYEGASCEVPVPSTHVRYGANNIYVYQQVDESITCNNATFGDPIHGVVKTVLLLYQQYCRL